jgi:hypothetical protein
MAIFHVAATKNFEKLNLKIPVLSVFEAKEIKVRDDLLQAIRNSNKRQLVGINNPASLRSTLISLSLQAS